MSLKIDSDCKIIGGRYYLHNVIAQTSHSRVFLATDLALDYRKCVVKQLFPSFCPSNMRSKIESSFLREVAISREIAGKHFQLCQFYNYFVESGRHYLVQEWIEGVTLKEKLSEQASLSESEIKSILGNILLVLGCVHGLGIVHNDIKPSNIILRSQDRLPVLVDFGIARKVDDNNYKLNHIAGTPGYMPWEQAMGKSSFANDLYGLGMTLIHLLTGKSPQNIDFNNQRDNLWQQVKTNFDPQLVAILDRAIAPERQQRFNSVKEMLVMWHGCQTRSRLSLPQNHDRSVFIKLEFLNLALILAISGVWLYLSYLIPQLDSKPPVKITNFKPTKSAIFELPKEELQPSSSAVTNKALQNIIFIPGTAAVTVRQKLGEPVWRRAGFWENSVAWSYENMVAEGIDLGYIFDTRTNKLRQVEIAIPPTTDLSTLELVMNSFLASEDLNSDLKRGLSQVYLRQENTYSFTTKNLQGIIQRNDRDRLYLAVWQADFH